VLAAGGRFAALESATEPGARGHASHGSTAPQAEAMAERCAALGFSEVRIDRHEGGRRPVVSVVATS
jgi:hypothetical protein